MTKNIEKFEEIIREYVHADDAIVDHKNKFESKAAVQLQKVDMALKAEDVSTHLRLKVDFDLMTAEYQKEEEQLHKAKADVSKKFQEAFPEIVAGFKEEDVKEHVTPKPTKDSGMTFKNIARQKDVAKLQGRVAFLESFIHGCIACGDLPPLHTRVGKGDK